MSLTINLIGCALIALIIWWFWLSRSGQQKAAAATEEATIVVDAGVYTPSVVHARAGKPLTLHFDRRDPSPCAEQVVFHGLEVSEFLETGKTTTVRLNDLPPGEYRFTCQMQMYQGRLLVD